MSTRWKWWALIKAFGTSYRFHPLFVLMLVLSVCTGYYAEMLTLFGIVLIHEMGHVAAARSFGWTVRRVELLPFGGVAEVDDSGQITAREELLVALAGPLQNVWMIGFSLLMQALGWGDPQWWNYFTEANLMIALFNLMPVLPLDGGKVLLALLSYVMSYHRALLFCSWMSLVMSVFICVGALLPLSGHGVQINVAMIGLFLFSSNWYGHRHIPFRFLRFLMGREGRAHVHLERGAVAAPIVTHESSRLLPVMRHFMREKYHLVYVLDNKGDVRRVVPEQKLVQTYLYEKKKDCLVSDL